MTNKPKTGYQKFVDSPWALVTAILVGLFILAFCIYYQEPKAWDAAFEAMMKQKNK